MKVHSKILVCCLVSILTYAGQAKACLFGPGSEDDSYRKARFVVVAKILRAELIETQSFVEATFQAIEVLKSAPSSDTKVRSLIFAPGSCGIPLLAGNIYLFFLRDDNLIDWESGSRMLTRLDFPDDKRLLDKLRNLKKSN